MAFQLIACISHSINVLGRITLVIVTVLCVSFLFYYFNRFDTPPSIPVVINTWAFTGSTAKSNFIDFLLFFFHLIFI